MHQLPNTAQIFHKHRFCINSVGNIIVLDNFMPIACHIASNILKKGHLWYIASDICCIDDKKSNLFYIDIAMSPSPYLEKLIKFNCQSPDMHMKITYLLRRPIKRNKRI